MHDAPPGEGRGPPAGPDFHRLCSSGRRLGSSRGSVLHVSFIVPKKFLFILQICVCHFCNSYSLSLPVVLCRCMQQRMSWSYQLIPFLSLLLLPLFVLWRIRVLFVLCFVTILGMQILWFTQKVQPWKFVPASRIEHSCASCLLPGCYFPQNVCCPSSKDDCVVVCGEMQRVLLAAELEHCLGYPRGHNASLVITIDQVDLSHVELQRMAILSSADPVLPLVTVLLSHCHVQDFKRASQLQSCAKPTWMVHSMCERVEKMRAEVPYLQDRISRKISVTGTMGLDEIEQNFHATAACSDLVQPQHALRQLDIPICFQEASRLPDDLDFAVRLSAGLCPGVPLHSVKNAFGNTSAL